MPDTTLSTTLRESVNIVLANLGETPVNSITSSSSLPLHVSLAINTIEEVSADVQSKGWWFNQQTGGNFDSTANVDIIPSNVNDDWSPTIPEEARRYITIRAARITQTRLIGSEELQKFSYNEELVSLAILQQAHVRNSNGELTFTDFPSELRNLGIDEVMFLQGNVEEKIGTIRLGGELASINKAKAETTLLGQQSTLVGQQAITEAAETTKRTREAELIDAQAIDVAADTTLKGKQGALIDAQELKTDAETTLTTKQGALVDAQELKTDAETVLTGKQGSQLDAQTSLLASQKTELDAKTAIDVAAEKAFYDGVVAGTQATYRDFSAEMRIMGIQESLFQSTPAYKKVELLKDAEKLRTVTATELGGSTAELNEVNKVMRFIGEPPVTALNSNSLASECVRLLRDTDAELQGRGWWFNTEEDVEFSPSNGIISIPSNILSLETNDYEARIQAFGNDYRLYDLNKKSDTSWSSTIKAKVVYQRSLNDTPSKYLEYLSVRVAILLTELYPQSGIDIQRLPKMEAELRAYFKDREADDANYSVFDNYDVAARLGVNRPHNIF